MPSMSTIRTETDKSSLLKIARQLPAIDVIYDCGARDALDGIELAQAFNASELHVFECNPPSVGVCRHNLAIHRPPPLKSYLCTSAISDRVGEITFHPIDTASSITVHKDGNPGASSLFLASGNYTKERYVQTSITVPTTTLDDYCRTHRPPDLLWLDLQGAELMAIHGAAAVLSHVKAIHLEIGCREMYKGQALFWDIHEALNDRFHLVTFDVGRWPKMPTLYRWWKWGPWLGNAIYVNRSELR